MESLCLEYLETIRSESNKTMQYKEAWIGTIGTFLIMHAGMLPRKGAEGRSKPLDGQRRLVLKSSLTSSSETARSVATRPDWAGAKAAADPARRAVMASFIMVAIWWNCCVVTNSIVGGHAKKQRSAKSMAPWPHGRQQHAHTLDLIQLVFQSSGSLAGMFKKEVLLRYALARLDDSTRLLDSIFYLPVPPS